MWPNPDDPREPMWLDEDRAWAIALTLEEQGECKGCGHPVTETADPRNEFAYEGSALRCHACTAKEHTAKKFDDAEPGLYLSVRKRG